MPEWTLYDYRKAIEELDQAPKWNVESADQLRAVLDSFRDQEPGMFILASPRQEQLRIGIGPSYGFAYWKDRVSGLGGPALADKKYADDDDFFLSEGLQEEIPSEQLMPVDRIIQLALSFYRTGTMPQGVAWKLWNPQSKTWELRHFPS